MIRRRRRRKLLRRWAALFVFLIAGMAYLQLLPAPQTVFAVSARTETVTFGTGNPRGVAFGLRHALLLHEDGSRSCLSDITVAPQEGAEIQYVRFGLDAVTITIDKARTDIRPRLSSEEAGQPPVQLVLDPADRDCPAPKLVRLPLFGRIISLGDDTSFSDDPRSPRLVLLSGTIRMLVRALRWRQLMLLVPDRRSSGEDDLFSADQMVLPPGSAVRESEGPDGKPTDWWGFVDVMFGEAAEPGIQVEASSHARSVIVTLPAAISVAGAEDRRSLSIDLAQRWSSDPKLRLISLFWATAGLLVTIGVSAWEALHRLFGNEAE